MNSLKIRLIRLTAAFMVSMIASNAAADDVIASTGLSGSDNDDVLTVVDPSSADADASDALDSDVNVDQTDVAAGEAELDLSVNASATATGIGSLDGNDSIDNFATANSTANANSGAGAGAIDATFDESTAMDASSSASSRAAGIDGGAASDTIINSGDVSATATATGSAQSSSSNFIDPNDPLATVQSDLNANTVATAGSVAIDAGSDRTASSTRTTTAVGADGLQIDISQSTVTLSADSSVTNSGMITSSATASGDSDTAATSLLANGSTNASADTYATATSHGLLSGGGNDTFSNDGVITSTSDASAQSMTFGLSAGQGLTALPGSNPTANASMATSAGATSVGIDTDGLNHNVDQTLSTSISSAGLSNSTTVSTTSNSGNDTVANTARIDAISSASSSSVAGSGTISGDIPSRLAALSDSNAYSAAISSGGADDSIDNQGALTATANSDASSLAINFASSGSAASSSADANVESDAQAVGISADGNASDASVTASMTIDANGASLMFRDERFAHVGDDTVNTNGDIDAIADAAAGAGALPIAINGSASSELTVDVNARSAAIDLGGGNDRLTGSGNITSTSLSSATAVGVAFNRNTGPTQSTKNKVDTSADAAAEANGIAGDSGSDSLVSTSLTLSPGGLTFTRDEQSTATVGDDDIDFDGSITVDADALATGVSAAITIGKTANAEMNSTATGLANAIAGGGGNDIINSGGSLSATSTANAFGVSATLGNTTSSNASANMVADAESNGIASDGGANNSQTTFSLTIDDNGIVGNYVSRSTAASGNDQVQNSAVVTSSATANTGGAAIVATSGSAHSSIDATANALARGIDAGSGDDDVDNSGDLTVDADSVAASINASITGAGSATSNSGLFGAGTRASADAVGLSTAGHDHDNSTTISAAIDFTAGVFVNMEFVSDDVSGDGDDSVVNSGNLISTSNATTVQATGGVTSTGSAMGIGRAEADAHAGSVETGNGDDVITNTGDLTSNATSTAVMVNATVAVASGTSIAGNTAWDGGTTATSTASGIDADSGVIETTTVDIEASIDRAQVIYDETTTRAAGNDTIVNSGTIEAHASSTAPTVTIGFTGSGLAATVSTSTADSIANGIRGGEGDDTIDNVGDVTTSASSTAVTANVSVTPFGAAVAADAVWDGGTTAEANAIGIAGDGGDQTATRRIAVGTDDLSFNESGVAARGADAIRNAGNVTVNADSSAVSVSGAAAFTGVAAATSTSTSHARAAGIDAGTADDDDTVTNSGVLTVTSNATAAAASISLTNVGLSVAADSVWDGGTSADARSLGIEAGGGDDTVINSGDINLVTNADSIAVSGALSVTGIAGAVSTANSTSDARGINGAGGADRIENSGDIDIVSDADATAVNVAVNGIGIAGAADAVWDSGTLADSIATGLDGGDGDDVIISTAGISNVVTADSTADSVGVAVSGFGYGVALTNSTAQARASGIDAGVGDDVVVNDSDITSRANTDAHNVAVTVQLAGTAVAGSADWDGEVGSLATANGIALGDGDDMAVSSGTVSSAADADADSNTVAINLVGVTAGIADTTSEASAFGFDAGDGNDAVQNTGDLVVSAISDATGRTLGGGLVGASLSSASAEAVSNATGIAGAEGDDSLINSGSIDSTATAVARARAINAQGGGFTLNSARTDAVANAFGMTGGDGNDTIINEQGATTDVNSSATTNAGSVAVTLVGAANGDAETLPVANSTGLAGGGGDDDILNAGELRVDGQSTGSVTGTSAALIGFASASTGTEAQVNATGIGGGDGADLLINTGTVQIGQAPGVSAATYWMAEVSSTGFSGSAVGGNVAESQSSAVTRSTGIDGGSDDDIISNEGNLDVYGTARNSASNSSLTLLGRSSSGADAGATAFATGLNGGSGNDTVMNSGDIGVLADTSVNMGSSSYTFVGSGGSDGTMTGRSNALGVDGGDGDDQIVNESGGTLAVRARSDLRSHNASSTFAGASGSVSMMTGRTDAIGIAAGAGNDDIFNDGAVTVDSEVLLVATGGSKTTLQFGGNASTGRVRTESGAIGFDAGDGNDSMTIGSNGSLLVRSVAEAEARNTASSSASFVSNTTAGTRAETLATAAGLDGGDGDNVIDIEGVITVATRSNAYAFARANGASISLSGDARGEARSNARAESVGITAADGANVVINSGNLTVDAVASTARTLTATFEILSVDGTNPITSRGTVEDDLLPDPDNPGFVMDVGDFVFWSESGSADCSGQNYACGDDPELTGGAYYLLDLVEVQDVDANGNPVFDANGDPVTHFERRWIRSNVVHATREEILDEFPTIAIGNGHGLDGDGTADARGTATAEAIGIELGDGDNRVLNEGDLDVTADALGSMRATSSGTAVGDATSRAHSTGNAHAFGIILGDGNNLLINDGNINVRAIGNAESTASAAAGGGICIPLLFWTWCPGPEGTPTRDAQENMSAEAFGIVTGDGDNTVENNGSLVVSANVRLGSSVSATAIRTGSGNDTVINNGLISALTSIGSTSSLGIAIDVGDGNDEVVLGDGSETIGRIILGEGDDTLTISGAPILNLGSDLSGGNGSDTLQLIGAGIVTTTLSSFEHAIKAGNDTFTLGGLAPLESLTIDGGTLELLSDYAFLDTGSFSTYFHGDGDSGRLLVDGAITADGDLTVERRGDTFIGDGARFGIVESNGDISGAFANVTLPEALPLLSFALDQSANNIDVVASAASFSTVANAGLHTTLAGNLFSIADDASGDFARDLGTIQQMRSGFDRTFASLSPDSFQAITTATIGMDFQASQMLRTHLGNARAVARHQLAPIAAYQPVTLAFQGGEIRTDGGTSALLFADAGGPLPSDDEVLANRQALQSTLLKPRLGQTWMTVYGANGEYTGGNGYTSIDQSADGFGIGIDYQIGDKVIAGFNFSRSNVSMDHSEAFAETNIDGWSAGLHATWFNDRTFVEGGYSISRQDINSQRELIIGTEPRTALGAHKGSSYMAFLGLGHQFELRGFRIEPYGTTWFVNIEEHGFSESGAGSFNQIVEARSNRALFLELGTRMSYLQQLDNSVIDWHASLAFDRDYDIDDGTISYAWAGAPDSVFTLNDRVLEQNSRTFGAGFNWIRDRSTISFDYRGQFNSAYRNRMFSAKLSYAF